MGGGQFKQNNTYIRIDIIDFKTTWAISKALIRTLHYANTQNSLNSDAVLRGYS